MTVELARACALTAAHERVAITPPDLPLERTDEWITAIAESIAVEAWPERISHEQLQGRLRSGNALIVRIEESSPPRYVAVVSGGRQCCLVMTPDARTVHVSTAALRDAIVREVEASVAATSQPLFDAIDALSSLRESVSGIIVRKKLASRILTTVIRLQPRAGAGVLERCRRARIPRQVGYFAVAYCLQHGLWLLSWWIAGQWALHGVIEWGWVSAWILMLGTMIPIRIACTSLQEMLSMRIGAVIKQRLLISGLSLDVDSLRSCGPSQFLARVLEAQVVENGLINGGFLALLSVIEIVYAAVVLSLGAVGSWHVLLLVLWTAFITFGFVLFFRRRKEWANARLAMTHEMTEGVIGHRTRVTQQPPSDWHGREDDAVRNYLTVSRSMDNVNVILTSIAWHGWVVVGVLALLVPILEGSFDTTALAISAGGILLAARALGRAAQAFPPIADALIAWEQVRRFLSVAPAETFGLPEYAVRHTGGTATVEARELVFSHADPFQPVVRGWSVRVDGGDRVLLEGASGSGKSTFISLVAGLRQAPSGTLLIDGMDLPLVGSASWRRHVVAVPQFHENHVVAETLAFNLLMGRRWPPTFADVQKARMICGELGLEPLLRRMPAGLFQFVGETGWKLSHGEKSRMFIARALLQEPDLVILDESFAALDPETLERAFQCTQKRAKALMVVAHP